jgi:hypothetical protein
VLDKMAAIQMLDVHFPTTDGRTLILSRHTEPNPDQKLLLKQLKLDLPPQPPPRLTTHSISTKAKALTPCTGIHPITPLILRTFFFRQLRKLG